MEPWLIVLCIVGGSICIVCEAFLPGGVLGALGGIAMIVAVVFGFKIGAEWGFITLIIAIVALAIAAFVAMRMLGRTPLGSLLTQKAEMKVEAGFTADEGLQALLGKEGVAESTLRPAGIAAIDGQRVNVVSEGTLIETGARVKVIEVEGNRIVVRPFVEES